MLPVLIFHSPAFALPTKLSFVRQSPSQRLVDIQSMKFTSAGNGDLKANANFHNFSYSGSMHIWPVDRDYYMFDCFISGHSEIYLMSAMPNEIE